MKLTFRSYVFVLTSVAFGRVVRAQQSPAPPAAPSQPIITPYRAPLIALVQPASGGSLPSDRPAAVFRFAQGEPLDPLDVRSFAVSVDGEDRSALFQVTSTEAWGSLSEGDLAPGIHQVTARICSSRGACTSADATVVATASVVANPVPTKKKKNLLSLLLLAARNLLLATH